MDRMVIWKFLLDRPMNTYGAIEAEMPIGSRALSCQEQNGQLWIWALLKGEHTIKYETRTFHVIGTGNMFDYQDSFKFIDTVQQDPFVWHIFEEVNDS